jgi:GntR family transcriptional repressor for pyruvate dehydrogenase complex
MSFDNVPPVRRGRLPQQVMEGIQRLLADGTFRPGDRLPVESALARTFGVGRNSVREAVRQLELLGVVEVRQGEGTFVRRLDASSVVAPFRAILALSSASTRQVLEFRRVLEPGIAALAAEHATPDQLALMERALERKVALQRAGTAASVLAQDLDFHLALAAAAGNPLVLGVAEALLGLLREFRMRLARSSAYSEELTDAERRVLDAVRRGDPKAASAAMREHMDLLLPYVPD